MPKARWCALLFVVSLLVASGCKDKDRAAGEPQPGQAARGSQPAQGGTTGQAGPSQAVDLVRILPEAHDLDARELVARAVKRKGGRERLSAIRTVKTRARADGARMDITIRFPDQLLVEYRDGEAITRRLIMNGDRVWVETSGQVREATADEMELLLASRDAETIPLLLAASAADAVVTYQSEADVAGQKAHVVALRNGGPPSATLFIAADGDDLVGIRYRTSRGPVTVVESDFRDVDGVRVAHASRVAIGAAVSRSVVESVTLDPEVGPDTFRPHTP